MTKQVNKKINNSPLKKLFAVIYSHSEPVHFEEAENSEEIIDTFRNEKYRVRIYEIGVKVFDTKYDKTSR